MKTITVRIMMMTTTTAMMMIMMMIGPTSVFAETELVNMLSNPSFEDTVENRVDKVWLNGAASNQTQDCTVRKHGRCSLRITDRKTENVGVSQIVKGLKPGRGYAVSGYIRLLNDKKGTLWQAAKATLSFSFTDDPDPPNFIMQAALDNETVPEEEQTKCKRSGEAQKQAAYLKPDKSKEITYTLAYRGFLTSGDGWVLMSGDINAPMREWADEVKFQINGLDTEIDFLLDGLELVEIPEVPNWMDIAFMDSENYRKSQFNIKFNLPAGVDPKDIDVEVKLKKHLFAFGAKIQPDCVLGPKADRYNNFVYSVFNWATIGSYKWKLGQAEAGDPDFSDAVESNEMIRKHDLKIRAHSILWGVTKNVPDWVQLLSPSELRKVVKEHVEYMVGLTKGKADQVDVQNEYVHGHFYEEKTQDRNFTMDVYKYVRELDPDIKLYLNDFMAVTTGAQMQDLHDLVKKFRKYGAPIDGIGIQGHTKDYVKPDPVMIWRRLDKLLNITGLEVMVTEFDVGHSDDVIRADWLEDAMRAFFAHPVLKGVILWGFWNTRMRYENKYLVYGDQFKLAEGGIRFACLVKKEWNTHQNFSLSQHSDLTVSVHGYHGDYDLIMRKKGVPVQLKTFSIKTAKTIDVTVTSSDNPIVLANETVDYVPECISHRDQKSLGKIETTVSSEKSGAHCVNRKQTRSDVHVSVTCKAGEVLVGCSGSYGSPDQDSKGRCKSRQGERITMENGIPTCNAHGKGKGSNYRVTAMARCCVVSSLKCDYRQAGPSLQMSEAMAETTCPKGSSALGCAAYSESTKLNGVVYREEKPLSCVTRNGPARSTEAKSGVMTSAPCCRKSGLKCVVVKSTSGDKSQVKCPDSGQVMTSCAGGGPIYKAEIVGDSCTVVGLSSVAIATCCSFP